MALQIRPPRPATPIRSADPTMEVLEVTLLELVTAVSEVADNEREVIATVVHMLASGRVRLCGTFRGQRLVPA